MSQASVRAMESLTYTTFTAVAPLFNRQLTSRNGWRKQRLRTLVRDNFMCQEENCTANRMSLLTIHHRVTRANGGNDNLDNLLTVCREHHGLLHSGQSIRLKSGEVCACSGHS